MNLTLPTPDVTIGPTWATQLNTALTSIDAHDHSSGKGTQVPTSGININSNLSFNSAYGITNATEIVFTSLTSNSATLNSVYVKSGDLYFNDSAGNAVRLTAAGSINVSSVGGIGGDYTTTAASLTYTDASLKYTFKDSAAANANVTCAALTCTSVTASGAVAASGALTVSGAATFNSTLTIAGTTTVSGDATFTGNTSGRGIVPVGAILPLMSHLTGITNVTATTAADANGYVVCGGQTISDVTSPMNGAVIPNINNSVFLMGSGTAGTTGGANSITLSTVNLPSHSHTINHGHANSLALSNATVPSSTHTHNMAHTHMWSFYDAGVGAFKVLTSSNDSTTTITSGDATSMELATAGSGSTVGMTPLLSVDTSLYTSGVLSPPSGSDGATAATGTPSATQTVSLSGAVTDHSGSSGSTGSGTSYDSRPSYITAKFIMRIK